MGLEWLKEDSNRQRGEFVLMVSGAPTDAEDGEGERVLKLLLAEGLPVKQAANWLQRSPEQPKMHSMSGHWH